MLRLLLDEHLSPRIVKQFRAKWPQAHMDSVLSWEGGRLAGSPDDVLLAEARGRGRTLVTYDQSTIIPLLKDWAEQRIEHGGVIFVDDRTIAQNDIGGLTMSLGALWMAEKNSDWTDMVIYLTRR
jgi:hypothetical protein